MRLVVSKPAHGAGAAEGAPADSAPTQAQGMQAPGAPGKAKKLALSFDLVQTLAAKLAKLRAAAEAAAAPAGSAAQPGSEAGPSNATPVGAAAGGKAAGPGPRAHDPLWGETPKQAAVRAVLRCGRVSCPVPPAACRNECGPPGCAAVLWRLDVPPACLRVQGVPRRGREAGHLLQQPPRSRRRANNPQEGVRVRRGPRLLAHRRQAASRQAHDRHRSLPKAGQYRQGNEAGPCRARPATPAAAPGRLLPLPSPLSPLRRCSGPVRCSCCRAPAAWA